VLQGTGLQCQKATTLGWSGAPSGPSKSVARSSCEWVRSASDNIPDVLQADLGKGDRKPPCEARPQALQGLPQVSSGRNNRIINCLWRAHAACTETDTICSARNMKLVTEIHEEGSRACSEHGCRFHQTLGLRTELFRHSHLSLLQSSPGLHASSAQPAGSDARDSGLVLNAAPKPLSPLPSPSLPACCAVSLSRGVQLSSKTEIAQMYTVCHSPSPPCTNSFLIPACHLRFIRMQLRTRDRVPRLRRVAATIVDPATRCINYNLSPGGFR
jgi:hypothetical protein